MEGILLVDPEIFLNLVVPSSAVSTMTMNDVPLAIDLFSPIGSSGYSGAQIPLVSNHFLELDYTFASSDPDVKIAGYFYGLGRYDSFGIPANFDGDQIELTASIAVTPLSETVFVGDRTTVTATVLDEHQQPVGRRAGHIHDCRQQSTGRCGLYRCDGKCAVLLSRGCRWQ